jgi:hypothetical protein
MNLCELLAVGAADQSGRAAAPAGDARQTGTKR